MGEKKRKKKKGYISEKQKQQNAVQRQVNQLSMAINKITSIRLYFSD